jgi:hypothetical protein
MSENLSLKFSSQNTPRNKKIMWKPTLSRKDRPEPKPKQELTPEEVEKIFFPEEEEEDDFRPHGNNRRRRKLRLPQIDYAQMACIISMLALIAASAATFFVVTNAYEVFEGTKGEPGEMGPKGDVGMPGKSMTETDVRKVVDPILAETKKEFGKFAFERIREEAVKEVTSEKVREVILALTEEGVFKINLTPKEIENAVEGLIAEGKVKLPRGEKGKKGDKGDQGEPGPRGFRGDPGKDGERGPQGLAGRPGRDGKDGAPGRDGVDGKDGQDADLVKQLALRESEIFPENSEESLTRGIIIPKEKKTRESETGWLYIGGVKVD